MSARRAELRSFAGAFVAGAVAVACATFPAARRVLSLDDLSHLATFPQANGGLPLGKLLLLRHWQGSDFDGIWRPLPKLLWTLLGPQQPGHTLAPWLVTAMLAGLCTGCSAALLQRWRTLPLWLATLLAFVPVLHPLAADVVLPFVGQADLLALAGVLAACWCWSRPGAGWAVAGAASLLAATFAKESAFPAGGAIAILLWLAPRPSVRRRRRLAIRALILGATVLGVRLGMQWILIGGTLSAAGAAGTAGSAAGGLATTLETLGRYHAALLQPWAPQTDYSFLKHSSYSSHSIYLAICLSILALMGVLMVAAWKSRGRRAVQLRAFAAAWLWFLLLLTPYLHLLPIGAMWAGRFAVVALVALPLALVALPRRVAAVGAAIFVVVGFAVIFQRAADWRSPRALWEAEVRRQPDHAFAWKNLAVELQRDGDDRLALETVAHATDLWPAFGEAWLARGQMASKLKLDAEATRSLETAATLLPAGEPQIELARLHARNGRFAEAMKMVESLPPAVAARADVGELRAALQRDLERAASGRP